MFEHLFQTLKVGTLLLKNRLIMPSIGMSFTEKGHVTERLIAFYSERANGGVGTIVVNTSAINAGDNIAGAGIYDDRFIPGLRKLVNAIHDGGASAVAQIIVSSKWLTKDGENPELIGPSGVSLIRQGPSPRSLTVDEIEQIVAEVGWAAVRARDASFDGIEFHAVAGESLTSQFLSPVTNKRTDAYGGSTDSRLRFLIQIIKQARKSAGTDYTYLCRFSGADFVEGGNSLEEGKKIAQRLEKEGIDALSVSTGLFVSSTPFIQMSVQQGAFVYLAEAVKGVVKIPVATGGRITSPVQAEDILASGRADLVSMARALIADPELPIKAKEGRLDDVRHCIACCYCYHTYQRGMECSVNARVGRESIYPKKTTPGHKKVLIIGGGPSGLEAARVAALRGHEVNLWEKKARLGGQLLLAAVPPGKQELNDFTKYLESQIVKTGVKVKLNHEASIAAIDEAKPDIILIATGGKPIMPAILGVIGKNVINALDVLSGCEIHGDSVAIVGGGAIGCETAEYLAAKGKNVTIFEMLERIGNDIIPVNRWVTMKRLKKAGVKMITRAKIEEIGRDEVHVSRDGSSDFFKVDVVVLAVGMEPDNKLANELKEKIDSIHLVGDCVRPRRIAQAVEEGFRTAWDI